MELNPTTLQQVLSSNKNKDYKDIIDNVSTSKHVVSLIPILLNHILQEDVPLHVSKPAIDYLMTSLDASSSTELMQRTIEALQNRSVAFEEQVMTRIV
jgi:hypothetical protein